MLHDLSLTLRYIRYLAPGQEEKARELLESLPAGWEEGIPRQCRYPNDGVSKLAIAHAVLEILIPGSTLPSHAVRALAVYIHQFLKERREP